MLASFDCETRGLFGEIFRIGYYDNENGYQNFYNMKEFIEHIYRIEEELPEVSYVNKRGNVKLRKDFLNIYAFNLEFDLGKLLQSQAEYGNLFNIEFGKSLIINGSFNTCKLKGKNIFLKDIYPIVNSSLEKSGKDFELKTFKKDLRVLEKDKYFKTVDANDKELLEYLKADVISTYELTEKIIALSKLTEEEFVKCPTVASLSMKIFKTNFKNDFETIKESTLLKHHEEFVREGYYGGRTEVFKPLLNDIGYHYDVNSLYPAVMEKNLFPAGKSFKTKDNLPQEDIFNLKDFIDKKEYLYIIKCTVDIPYQNIPPLPYRDKKLLFPIGKIEGTWTNVELNFALENANVKILTIENIIWWKEKTNVFERFVNEQKKIKLESTGAKRLFAKLIQNSLYGKFGMKRCRISYTDWTEEKQEKIREKSKLSAKIITVISPILKYEKTFFADYIRPHFAVFVTAYARIELLKMMKLQEIKGNSLYYCDTDSIVVKERIEQTFVDDNEYGKWALERTIKKGIFILPKLYSEIDFFTSKEILKSKGIIREYKEKVRYNDYVNYYNKMVAGTTVELYGDTEKYYGRMKILTALKSGKSFDEKILLKKRFCFSNLSIHKRVFDFEKNISQPIRLS